MKVNLLKEFPLGVSAPSLRGRWLMLKWWTHSDQNHIILAKTEKALIKVYQQVLEKHGDGKPLALWRINIVRPPAKIALAHAKNAHSQEIKSFTEFAADLAKRLDPLPEGFRLCEKYESLHGNEDDEWYRDTHIDCKNCHHGVKFKVLKLYESRRFTYRAILRNSGARADEVPSRAGPSDPAKTLMVVSNHFGHHEDGVVLEEVKRSRSYFSHPRFFCHAQELAMPLAITSAYEDLDVQRVNAEAEREKERLVREEAERVAGLWEAKLFFKGVLL